MASILIGNDIAYKFRLDTSLSSFLLSLRKECMEPISDVEFATDSHIIAEENEQGLIKIEGICKDANGRRAHCLVMVNGDQFGNLLAERWRIVLAPEFEIIGEEQGLPVLLAQELRGFVKHIDPDERFFV